MVIVVMGVSGSGKTTVGLALAEALEWRFADADSYHPPENVAKMARGEGLTDADRAPWLAALRARIAQWLAGGTDAVLACSALKDSYRSLLESDEDAGAAAEAAAPGARRVDFVYLKASQALIAARLRARVGHFATVTLVPSQFQALEEPDPRQALVIDAALAPAAIVAEVRRGLKI